MRTVDTSPRDRTLHFRWLTISLGIALSVGVGIFLLTALIEHHEAVGYWLTAQLRWLLVLPWAPLLVAFYYGCMARSLVERSRAAKLQEGEKARAQALVDHMNTRAWLASFVYAALGLLAGVSLLLEVLAFPVEYQALDYSLTAAWFISLLFAAVAREELRWGC
ncbi:hypothetical protein D3C81_606540 [compost metagenome]